MKPFNNNNPKVLCEIQQILLEPEVINLLNDMKENPQDGMKAIKQNSSQAAKIEKLIAAGVIKTG